MSREVGAPAGNLYDKAGTRNPVARRLLDRFDAAVDGLIDRAAPASILDVGCGEGAPAARWACRPGVDRAVGVDLDDAALRAEWSRRRKDGLSFQVADATALPFPDGSFELVAAVESLEHMAEPDAALDEMARCARRHLLVTVPREPLWRALNVARGAHLRDLGDTPGHLHHFSPRSLRRLLERHGAIRDLRTPLPWIVALVELGPSAHSYASASSTSSFAACRAG